MLKKIIGAILFSAYAILVLGSGFLLIALVCDIGWWAFHDEKPLKFDCIKMLFT